MKKFKKIYIEITNRCNLSCPFCIKNDRVSKDMSIEEIDKVFSEVKEYTDYVYLHILGEPLLHHDILSVFDLANKHHLKVNLTTNGSLLFKYYKELLSKKSLRQINVSMHSLVNEEKKEKEVYLQTIKEMIEIVTKEKNIYLSLRLWIENSTLNKEILSILEEKLDIHPLDFEKIDNVFLSSDEEFVWPSLKNDIVSLNGFCYGGVSHIGVLSNGEVVLCCLDSKGDTSFGNIFTSSLKDILESKKFTDCINMRKNNKFSEELCLHCSYHLRFKN